MLTLQALIILYCVGIVCLIAPCKQSNANIAAVNSCSIAAAEFHYEPLQLNMTAIINTASLETIQGSQRCIPRATDHTAS